MSKRNPKQKERAKEEQKQNNNNNAKRKISRQIEAKRTLRTNTRAMQQE